MKIFNFLTITIACCAPVLLSAAEITALQLRQDSIDPDRLEHVIPYYIGVGAQYSPQKGSNEGRTGLTLSLGGAGWLNNNWSFMSEYLFKWSPGVKERYTYAHHREYPVGYGVEYATYQVPQMFYLQIPYIFQYRHSSMKWLGLQMGVKVDYNWIRLKNRKPILESHSAGIVLNTEPSPFEGITSRDGLRRWGWGGIAGLHILLGKYSALDLRYNYAFNDLSRNSFFKDGQRIGDTGFQAVFQRLITPKKQVKD